MGYRSDVLIAVAFRNKEERDEVWAVYCMDPRVQKHNLAGQWKNYDEEGGYPVLWYEGTDVKWYGSYEDVSGIEHLVDTAYAFAQERGHTFGSINYRIGEDLNDIEAFERAADPDGSLLSYLFDLCGIHRELTHNFN